MRPNVIPAPPANPERRGDRVGNLVEISVDAGKGHIGSPKADGREDVVTVRVEPDVHDDLGAQLAKPGPGVPQVGSGPEKGGGPSKALQPSSMSFRSSQVTDRSLLLALLVAFLKDQVISP